jgi:hypothetical protein
MRREICVWLRLSEPAGDIDNEVRRCQRVQADVSGRVELPDSGRGDRLLGSEVDRRGWWQVAARESVTKPGCAGSVTVMLSVADAAVGGTLLDRRSEVV